MPAEVKIYECEVKKLFRKDWFSFWLKGEEDLDPMKSLQYKRWRKLRDLQRARSASDTGAQEKGDQVLSPGKRISRERGG